VKPRSTFRTSAIMACVLALFVAQTLGSRIAYFCLCSGKPIQTLASHCHGPHGEQCHGGGESLDSRHSDEGPADRKDHRLVDQELKAASPKTGPPLATPPLLLAVLPSFFTLSPRIEAKIFKNAWVRFGESPPSGVTVALTVVLLI